MNPADIHPVHPDDAKVGDWVILIFGKHREFVKVKRRTPKQIEAGGFTYQRSPGGFWRATHAGQLIATTPELVAEIREALVEKQREDAARRAALEAHMIRQAEDAAAFVKWVRDGGDMTSVLDRQTLADAWEQVKRRETT